MQIIPIKNVNFKKIGVLSLKKLFLWAFKNLFSTKIGPKMLFLRSIKPFFECYDPNFLKVFVLYRYHLHLVKKVLGSVDSKWPKMALEVVRFRDISRKLLGKVTKGLLITPAS